MNNLLMYCYLEIILKIKKFYNFLILLTILFLIFHSNKAYNKNSLDKNCKKFIKDCYNLKLFNDEQSNITNKLFLSVCLPIYNMQNYIERSLLSIINQSFKKIEIILVNDNSNDNTLEILNKYIRIDKRIKLINHSKNLGVYKSRIDAAFIAKGQYILFIDPDDMILNPNLFEILYNYNLYSNLDMIEFTVFHKKDWKRKIFFPVQQHFNHNHNYNKNIIYQPELSNIIFYYPNTNKIVPVHCRTIWNKIIRRNIMLKTIYYLETIFHDKILITADDTPMNIVNFQFANNYSNIKVPGYLYIIRKNSASNIGNSKKQNKILYNNYFLYHKFLFKYIRDFNKSEEFLSSDLKSNYQFLFFLEGKDKKEAIIFFDEIIKKNISYKLTSILLNITEKYKYYQNY